MARIGAVNTTLKDVEPYDGRMDRSSGLCTEEGTKFPEGARVSELVWSTAGPSGAMAWTLIPGDRAARSGLLAAVMVHKP
jgi:hypothetical protein